MSATLLLSLALSVGGNCPAYVQAGVGGDYNNPDDARGLGVVEQFHFSPAVEALQRGMTGGLGADIGYTLEHFPNHPRALAAMARLGLRLGKPHAPGARFSVECYFARALDFRPEDAAVRGLYGTYLMARKDDDGAAEQLEECVRLRPNDATGWYNLGLVRMRQNRQDDALQAAVRAYALGFPLPGLRRRLEAAGHKLP